MDATYLVFMLTFAASIQGIQSATVNDVDQAAKEKVAVIVDKTSTMIRNPRIFFPLTTSTKTATATGSVTLCMVTQSTGLTACGRKRRMGRRRKICLTTYKEIWLDVKMTLQGTQGSWCTG